MRRSRLPQITAEHTVPVKDQGAETARRYRFQHTWAAIACCALFDQTRSVEEVYCEHHEDVLLRHTDGTFSGHQVKSRGADQRPWKATDAHVKAAFGQFVRLEARHPDQFRSFCFLTNHPFHRATNAASVVHILNTVCKATTTDDLPRSVQSWLIQLAVTSDVDELVVFRALKKTTVSSDLPKLDDALNRLVQTLGIFWDQASECSVEVLTSAARRLIDECSRASSLDHQQLLPAYLGSTDSIEVANAALINGKRMTLERVQRVLHEGMNTTAPLTGPSETLIPPGRGSTDLLRRKLAAGGFSMVSSNSAEDLRDRADYLGIAWTKRLGASRGLDRYGHIRALVLNDAARAFEATRNDDHPYGPEMREALRARFRDRRSKGEQLYDCSDEHLEGMAYSLTAQCTIYWSNDET